MSVKRSFDTGIIYNIHRKNTLPGGTTMSELSDKIRSEFKKADDERDALMNTPEDIERWDNIVYGHMTGRCRSWMYTDRSRHREKTFRSLSAFMEEPGCMEIKKDTSTIV